MHSSSALASITAFCVLDKVGDDLDPHQFRKAVLASEEAAHI
jgi:hypothetical protein